MWTRDGEGGQAVAIAEGVVLLVAVEEVAEAERTRAS